MTMSNESQSTPSQEGWFKRKARKAGNDMLLLDRQTKILGGIKKDLGQIASAGKTRRHESFEEAVERLNLSDDDLAKRHRNLCIATRTMHVGGICMTLLLVWTGWQGNILQFVSALSISLICFVGGALNAFRAWQIEQRALGGFNEWLHSPEHWTK